MGIIFFWWVPLEIVSEKKRLTIKNIFNFSGMTQVIYTGYVHAIKKMVLIQVAKAKSKKLEKKNFNLIKPYLNYSE